MIMSLLFCGKHCPECALRKNAEVPGTVWCGSGDFFRMSGISDAGVSVLFRLCIGIMRARPHDVLRVVRSLSPARILMAVQCRVSLHLVQRDGEEQCEFRYCTLANLPVRLVLDVC